MEVFTHSKGIAAANLHLSKDDNKMIGQLTLDWSYDSFYFKYKDEPWIILSYGPRGNKHEFEKIDSEDKKIIFSKLRNYAFSVMNNYSKEADIALKHLRKLVF
jgi:hypothetical protein